jgi:hypothetical protein
MLERDLLFGIQKAYCKIDDRLILHGKVGVMLHLLAMLATVTGAYRWHRSVLNPKS